MSDSVQGIADYGRVDDGHCRVCPRCGQFCFARYPLDGMLVCGWCFGIGPDGLPTGRRGKLPEAECPS